MNDMVIRLIKSCSKIEIIYLDSNNRFSQRVIRPMKLNEGTVSAYCYARRQVRTFHLENILSAEPIQKSARVS